jgi:hypothetical protein
MASDRTPFEALAAADTARGAALEALGERTPPPPAAPVCRVIDVGPEPPRWTLVAAEGELLELSAPTDLRYGDPGGGGWIIKHGVAGQIRVSNEAFGVGGPFGKADPAPGVVKRAEAAFVWQPLAEEGDTVALRATPLGSARRVRFGVPGVRSFWGGAAGWVERALPCGGEPVKVQPVLFGGEDPAPYVRKRLEVAMPPPRTRLLGCPSEPPRGGCVLCGCDDVPALAACGAAAHALCLPCALQALRAELAFGGFGVNLSFPILCPVCKPRVYPPRPGAPPLDALDGWWLPPAVDALRSWSGEAAADARDGHAPLGAREAATFQAHLVAALARAPPEEESARAARLRLRDAVFVCPNAACGHPSLVDRHEAQPFILGVVVAASAEEQAGDGGGGAAPAAAAPARHGAPADCPLCRTRVCLDCGKFWAMGLSGGTLFPVSGVSIGSHSARSCGDYAAHVAALPRDAAGLVGVDASGLAEVAGSVPSPASARPTSPSRRTMGGAP